MEETKTRKTRSDKGQARVSSPRKRTPPERVIQVLFNEAEEDLLAYVKRQPNRSEYIKSLIRQDEAKSRIL